MAVLRGNKDSLMAVLEAFVYDPLLNWRLVVDNAANAKTTRRSKSRHESSTSSSGQVCTFPHSILLGKIAF